MLRSERGRLGSVWGRWTEEKELGVQGGPGGWRLQGTVSARDCGAQA